MSNAKHSPDFLFEVSWEVCNKVGGIHTVISTKAQTVTRKFADRYILLGPDLSHEGVNPEFEEDPALLKAWRQKLYNEGVRVRVGRWKIKGEPTAVLVDFSSLIPRKDEILKSLLGVVPRGFDLGTVGLHRAGALRLGRRRGDRLPTSRPSAPRPTRPPRISTNG